MPKFAHEFPPIHVIICGDRSWDDDYIVTLFVTGLKFWHGLNIHFWHGDASGADALAKEAAKFTQGIRLHPFSADWNSFGRSAGPKRNRKLMKSFLETTSRCKSSRFAIAFKDDLHDPKHKGTADMVKLCLKNDIPVYQVARPLIEDF